MKKNFTIIGFCLVVAFIIVNGLFNKVLSDRSGAEAGVSGSPGDGHSCTLCHSPSRNFSGGTVTTNIPTAGYTPGQTYTITAGIIRAGHVVMGFELSPQDTTPAGNILGTITITNSYSQLAQGYQGWITHTLAGTNATDGAISWSFNWTAPATGKGPVVFYADFNASNDNGQDTGDSIFLTSLKVYENLCGPVPATPGSISGSTSVCSGVSSTYSVTSVSGATSYNWTLPSGWTGSSSTNSITATTGTAGGTISVTATNACGTSSASTLNVTVNSPEAASIAISADETTICSGVADTFTAVATNGGAMPAYQWQVNGGNVGSSSSVYTSSVLQNGDMVSCILTSDLECVTGSPATSNDITITVNPQLTPSVTIISNAPGNTICSGDSVTFSLSPAPVNGGTSPTFQWLKNDEAINSATATTYTTNTLTNGNVISVQMTSNATCASPEVVTSAGITMTVNPNVVPADSIVSSLGNSACLGQNVTFTSNAVNEGTGPTYQWLKNGGVINGATSSTYSTTSLANGNVISLQMTSDAVCATPTLVTSNAISMTITDTVLPSVTVTPTALNDSICSGTSVSFTANPSNGGTTPTYQWVINGDNVNGATSAVYASDSVANGDMISVRMSSSAACATPSLVSSNSVTMVVTTSVTPAVIIISNSGSSICAGQLVTFTASSSNGGSSPAYQWIKNGVNIAGAHSSVYASDTLNNGDAISVQMTSDAPCASPETVTSNVINMSIVTNAVPAVTISSDIGDTICSNQNPVFTATPVNGGNSPVYQWLKNGLIVGDTTSTYSPSSLADGDIIQVKMESSSQCVVVDSALSNIITIHVIPAVTASVTISSGAGDTICSGQPATITALPVNGGTAPQFQWLKNGENVGGDSITYTPLSISDGDIISVQMTSSLQCAVPQTVLSDSVYMTVLPDFTPMVTISSGSGDTICTGQTALFSAAPVNGGSNPQYQWQVNGSNITGQTSSTYSTAYLANNDIVSVSMISSLNCATPQSVLSDPVIISVVSPPSEMVAFTSSTGDTICPNQSVTFTAVPTYGGAVPNYQWFSQGQELTGETNPTFTDTALTNGDVITLQMVSNALCASTGPVTSVPDTIHVITAGGPTISISSDTGNDICEGTAVTFNAIITNGGSSPAYQWQKNGLDVGNNSGIYTDDSLVNGDVITCSVTSSLMCAEPATAVSDSVVMTVYPLPEPTITLSNDSLVTIQGTAYVWYSGYSNIFGANGQSFKPLANGYYTVLVEDAEGCKGISAPFDVTFLGIEEISSSLSGISIYPNPTDGIIYIEYTGNTSDAEFEARLLDINGRLIVYNNNMVFAGNRTAMDINALQDGIYILQLSCGAESVFKKIILTRQ